MRTILLAALAASHWVLAIAAHAQGAPQPRSLENACSVAAMTDYTKSNLALLQQGTPLMSVEALVAQRRLQEQFCMRFVSCVVRDPSSLRFMSAFDSCLKDESLEKYEAEPRK
jgi:hypothetical protein